ncbi:RES family NAD+ phosphorylase [Niveibacterium sp. 24ML]|uniref:RES family NAD+ phosphorylase n=1 Tax=Niveibacterium sp. 24ML TaxID=2985512 RepID=UPI00226F94F5|nr:RES family NAD+ phosphorylase [Niveibacterium sp. 24ML]MCX9156372.1 RES family NAD+ phosphorylase [Niveibacterium sp. 24ML]
MSLTVWRLVTARFADTAFSGEGARLYGGRWNRKHVPMVYTAATQSLAMLELLVQDDPLRARYVMIPAFIPDQVQLEQLAANALPEGWREMAAREHLQQIGSEWARSARSAVLAVPSAVIPSETNYLLNPLHPAFHQIQIGEPLEFITDLRLIRRSRGGTN